MSIGIKGGKVVRRVRYISHTMKSPTTRMPMMSRLIMSADFHPADAASLRANVTSVRPAVIRNAPTQSTFFSFFSPEVDFGSASIAKIPATKTTTPKPITK
jgi:hypothetical protein